MTDLLVKLFIKNYKATSDPSVRHRYGTLGGIVGIACNLLLFCFKLFIGIISGSVSIMADAFNNLSDMGSSVITMLGFKIASKPADPEHPFGHGRYEYMSAFIVAILIILVGLELLKSSAEKIFNPEALTVNPLVLTILLISVGIKFWMYLFNRKLGKKINSESLKATARDSLNDCIMTSVVIISMIIFRLTEINIDAYVGLGVAVFIIYSGFKTAKDTLHPLLGAPPEPEMIEGIQREIFKFPEFEGMHDLIIHNYGPGRCFASVHVEVPADIDITACHELIDLCEVNILENHGIHTVIHMDPLDTNNDRVNGVKNELVARINEINPRLTIHDFRMVEGKNRNNLIFDVVLPLDLNITPADLRFEIGKLAKEIDPTFCCVITVDIDYSQSL